VRNARETDAAALAAFFIQAWKEAGPTGLGFTGVTDEAIKKIASEEFLLRRLKDPSVRFAVVEQEGRILGFASLKVTGSGRAELSGIVVLQSATGQGLGTRLLRRACSTAVELGIRKLEVKTEVFNKVAIGLYKNNGFAETRKTTVKVGKTKVPLQVLEKNLR
jgi:N-acetylglutamate synthase-like GNAT family acetyltransferase